MIASKEELIKRRMFDIRICAGHAAYLVHVHISDWLSNSADEKLLDFGMIKQNPSVGVR